MAAPALSSTMSHAGPGSPSSTDNSISFACVASHTFSTSLLLVSSPNSPGRIVYSLTSPSFSSPIRVSPLRVISSHAVGTVHDHDMATAQALPHAHQDADQVGMGRAGRRGRRAGRV